MRCPKYERSRRIPEPTRASRKHRLEHPHICARRPPLACLCIRTGRHARDPSKDGAECTTKHVSSFSRRKQHGFERFEIESVREEPERQIGILTVVDSLVAQVAVLGPCRSATLPPACW